MSRIYEDLFGGWSKKEAIYAWFLIGLQVLVFVLYPESLLGFIAGTSGTICVLLVAKGKISNYFFGFVQTGIIMVLGFQAFVYGEAGENLFYFISQFWGIKEWKNNLDKETEIVKTQKLSIKNWLIVLSAITLLTFIFSTVLELINGAMPFEDALTLALAMVAQVLMVYRFREQWLLWGVLNVVSVYQWISLGNMSLAAMYIALLINTVYGYVNWSKQQKEVQLAL